MEMFSQMMAFPLSSTPQLPWSQQAMMTPLVTALNSMAAIAPSDALVLPFLAAALVWLGLVVTLAGLVGASYHRERHSMAAPVKVSRPVTTRYTIAFYDGIS